MMDLNGVEICSERVRLIPITMDYAQDIFDHFTAEVTTYMYPKPSENLQSVNTFIESSLKGLDDGTNLQMVILDKSTGEFMGCCGCHHIGDDDPELGIWIKKPSHGHGYGLEAVTAVIKWAKENLTFDHLKYPVDKRNFASKRIPEANGGKYIKEFKEVNQSGKELELLEYWIY